MEKVNRSIKIPSQKYWWHGTNLWRSISIIVLAGLWPLMASFCCLFIIYLAWWWWSVTRYKECCGLMYWWQNVYPDNQWRAEDREEANNNRGQENLEFRETLKKWNKLSVTRLECWWCHSFIETVLYCTIWTIRNIFLFTRKQRKKWRFVKPYIQNHFSWSLCWFQTWNILRIEDLNLILLKTFWFGDLYQSKNI